MGIEKCAAPDPYIGGGTCGSRTIGIMMSSVGDGEPLQMECIQDV